MEARITQFFERYIRNAYFPEMHLTDIVEILIIAFLVYQLMIWIKNTKAWMLLKGILVLGVFIFLAYLFQMHTILWIVRNSLTVLATALIVVFQPELRRALEKLGERKYISVVMPFDSTKDKGRFSEDTVDGIIDASYIMGKAKTGALIVVEQAIRLTEMRARVFSWTVSCPARCLSTFLSTTHLCTTAQLLFGMIESSLPHVIFLCPITWGLARSWEQDTERQWGSAKSATPLSSSCLRRQDMYLWRRAAFWTGIFPGKSSENIWKTSRTSAETHTAY